MSVKSSVPNSPRVDRSYDPNAPHAAMLWHCKASERFAEGAAAIRARFGEDFLATVLDFLGGLNVKQLSARQLALKLRPHDEISLRNKIAKALRLLEPIYSEHGRAAAMMHETAKL